MVDTTDRRSRPLAAVVMVVLLGVLGCSEPTKPSPQGLTATIGACTYRLATDGVPDIIPAGGGTFTLTLTTDFTCAWTAEIPNKLFMFLEIAPAKGVGPATLVVTVRPHTGMQNRAIDLTVATMTVSTAQAAAPATIPGPNAILAYSGTAGETLSFGQAGVATTDQYRVTAPIVNGSMFTVNLTLDSLAPAPQPFPRGFSIYLEGPTGIRLAPGFYGNAIRWTNGIPTTSNQLNVAVGNTTCSSAFEGHFEIFDIVQASDGRVSRLHGKVVQRCLVDPLPTSLTLEFWYPSKASF